MKDIAKSLHTVTVLQQVANAIQSMTTASRVDAMTEAMGVLGLAGRPDPYGLEEKALRMMDKA